MDLPLSQVLEVGTAADLLAWQKSSDEGYFFLDAVDESKLARPSDFERAILKFVDAIEPYKDRVKVVLSTRPHAWQAYADREMLSRRLGLPRLKQSIGDSTQADQESIYEAASATSSTVEQKETASTPDVTVLQLAPFCLIGADAGHDEPEILPSSTRKILSHKVLTPDNYRQHRPEADLLLGARVAQLLRAIVTIQRAELVIPSVKVHMIITGTPDLRR